MRAEQELATLRFEANEIIRNEKEAVDRELYLQELGQRDKKAAKRARLSDAAKKAEAEQIHLDGKTVKELAAWQKLIKKVLNSPPWTYLTIFNTLYALFSIDICLLLLPKTADIPQAWVTFVVFLCFLFEMTGNILAKRDYGALAAGEKYNMFFWLDFVGTFSLIPDFLLAFGVPEQGVPDQVILARVARAARIGARLSRLTKIIKIGGKVGKTSMEKSFEKLGIDATELDSPDTQVGSQIGAAVAEGISKRVIGLVIVLLVFVPIFQFTDPVGGVAQTKTDMLKILQGMKKTEPSLSFELGASPAYTAALDTFRHLGGDELIYFTWNRDIWRVEWDHKTGVRSNVTCDVTKCIENSEVIRKLRKTEMRKYGDKEDTDPASMPPERYEYDGMEMWVNYQRKSQDDALMNIFYMVFVMFIFAISSLVFMSDLEKLVIQPVGMISSAVKLVANKLMDLGGVSELGEAAFVESSVLKIVSLLQVSFGEAGASIIGRNMSETSDQIQLLMPGAPVQGFFSYVDIRQFGAVTEALREDSILFVNEVAERVR